MHGAYPRRPRGQPTPAGAERDAGFAGGRSGVMMRRWRLAEEKENGSDGGARRAARRRPRRRRAPALAVIIVVGLAAVAVVFALASVLEDERPHGPYLIGAWTFGDRDSLQHAVDAGAIDEVSVDWLQSRADGSVAAPKLDAGFIAEARKQDCRVIVTLTDYDEATHQFDPAIAKAILATARDPPPPRRGRRRLVPRERGGRRGRRLGGAHGRAAQRLLDVRRGARPAAARRRPPHRRRRLPQDQRAGRLGRAAGAGLAAPGPGGRPVPRDDLQLLGVLVRARPALAARVDGRRCSTSPRRR